MTSEHIEISDSDDSKPHVPNGQTFDKDCRNMEELIDEDLDFYLKDFGFSHHFSINPTHRIKTEEKLGIKPASPADFYNLGVRSLEAGNLDDAKKCFDKTIKLSPNHAGSFYNLGMIAIEKGKKADAKKHLTKFVELEEKKQQAIDEEWYYDASIYGTALVNDKIDYLQLASEELNALK